MFVDIFYVLTIFNEFIIFCMKGQLIFDVYLMEYENSMIYWVNMAMLFEEEIRE